MSAQNETYIVRENCSRPKDSISLTKGQIKLGENYPLHNEGSSDMKVPHKNGISLEKLFDLRQPTTSHQNITSYTERRKDDRMDLNSIDRRREREMPRLIKETDADIKSSQLTNSSIFNQRYQNVLKFPNYRPRKKCAFEKKLRRCGVELDGESTISNIRKILQPFICQEINNILEKYIDAYFMKAFNNIRENINLSSENWSQTLKCSISKALYKQYCDNANVDPFDPLSIADDDFSYFKSSQNIKHKHNNNNMTADNSVKSEIDNSTGHTSDTNSQCSHLSIVEEKFQIKPLLNTADMSSSSEPMLECSFNRFNGHSENHISRKRNNHLANRLYTEAPENPSKCRDTPYSLPKCPKIVCPGNYAFNCENNSSSLILQNPQDVGKPETARFENRNQSFFLVRNSNEQTPVAISSEIYLSTRNSMSTTNNSNSNNDHLLYPHDYHC